MLKIPLSLQLWSLREATKSDFAATMKEVAELGFSGVETAGFGNLSPKEAAEAVKAAGLQCSGMHVSIDAFRSHLNEVVLHAQMFETTHLIVPFFPPALLQSPEAFAALGDELDALGQKLRAYGMELHYHNHGFEIARYAGRLGIDWLLDAIRPGNLSFELDVYWAHVGGKDPAALIREQGRRIRLIHLKDEKEIGGGPVDFPAVFEAIDAVGAAQWLVVEVEQYNFEPLESVRRSLAKLREWKRA